jgi:TRAP transporter TAXI family solute receptor
VKHRIFVAATAVFGLAVSALAQDFITIGSGSTAGVYFPIATGMAKFANDANIGVRANARSTGGSVFNINAINAGELQMALAQNDVASYAYNGNGIAAFEGKPVKTFKAVAVLYPEIVHVIARKDAGVRNVGDLKGKRVVVGDVGSGTEQNTIQVLEAYGLKFADLGQTIRVPPAQGQALLQDGKADAMFFTGGLGAATIAQIAQTVSSVLVEVDYDRVVALAKKYPFYTALNIPGGIYKGNEITTPSVAVKSMLLAADSLSADVVYKFLKANFSDVAEFKKIHPSLERFFDIKKTVKNLPVPLHPGAERYFKEIGVLK